MVPKTSQNDKFYSFKRCSAFGIRKWTVGVVSVSLGTALVAAPSVQADSAETVVLAPAVDDAEMAVQAVDKADLSAVLELAKVADLSGQDSQVTAGFVEVFDRATAVFDKSDATQEEVNEAAQLLREAVAALETAGEEDLMLAPEVNFATTSVATAEKIKALQDSGSIPKSVVVDAGFPQGYRSKTTNLLTSVNIEPNLADVFAPLYPAGTTFEWFAKTDDVFADMTMPTNFGNFSTPQVVSIGHTLMRSVSYVAILADGTRIARAFPSVQVTDTDALQVNIYDEPDAKKMLRDSKTLNILGFVAPGTTQEELADSYTYTWTVKPDTSTAGNKSGVITVTSSRGTTVEYWVTVTVRDTRPQAEQFTPTTAEQRVALGATADPAASVTNRDSLPAGTRFEWVTQPDTSLTKWESLRGKATPTYDLKVIYPDGSSEVVQAPVKVWAMADARTYTNLPYPNITFIKTTKGVLPSITTFFPGSTLDSQGRLVIDDILITWSGVKVDGSEYNSFDPVNNAIDQMRGKPTQSASFTYTFSDGSQMVRVINPVFVDYIDNAAYYTPTTVQGGVTVGLKDTIDPASFIGNKEQMPNGTRYELVTPTPTLKPGLTSSVVVKVVFPDGSSKLITSRLNVSSSQSQRYSPLTIFLRLALGTRVQPKDFITNIPSLPANTNFSWVKEPNLRTPGTKSGQILATYPDGSTDIISVRFSIR